MSDDGCGIRPEHLKQIFEPFCSMRKGGTGLGLFLSLNFVRACGGDITVSSAVGSGSTFEVTLPALGGHDDRGALTVKPHPSLLLVDDDDAFRMVMAGELERAGFEVVRAASGARRFGPWPTGSRRSCCSTSTSRT